MAIHLLTKTLLMAVATVLMLVACGPSADEINQIVDDRVAQALTAVPTPTPLSAPTQTPSAIAAPTATRRRPALKKGALRALDVTSTHP